MHNTTLVPKPMTWRPLESQNDRRVSAMAIRVQHAHVDDVRAGRDANILAVGALTATGDGASYVRTVSAGVRHRSNRVREIDSCQDAVGRLDEVRVVCDAGVQHRN